jgi:hypothetical protein
MKTDSTYLTDIYGKDVNLLYPSSRELKAISDMYILNDVAVSSSLYIFYRRFSPGKNGHYFLLMRIEGSNPL